METARVVMAPEVYQSRLDVLSRKVGYPKLVVANDFYTDRSLEDVTNIEVVDLHLKMAIRKTARPLLARLHRNRRCETNLNYF